jgi:GTP cyclohydrolase I/GTP cyclohydrolase-4
VAERGRQPRFVEDCVREAVRMAVAEFESLGPDAFVLSRQENLETIHQHNVMAERYGLIGELAGELDGGDHVLRETGAEVFD